MYYNTSIGKIVSIQNIVLTRPIDELVLFGQIYLLNCSDNSSLRENMYALLEQVCLKELQP